MFKSLKKTFSYKLTKIWAFSYLCILLLPIILGFTVYINILNILSKNIEDTNLTFLNNSKTYMDTVLSSIINASSSFQNNQVLTDIYNSKPENLPPSYNYEEKNSIWSAHNVFSQYIANKYVFFPSKNLIYTGDITVQPHYLYLSLYSNNNKFSEDEWMKNILKYTKPGFVKIEAYSGHPKIFYISPVYSSGKIIYNTIIELKWTALSSDAAGSFSNSFFMSAYNQSLFYSEMDAASHKAAESVTYSSSSFNTATIDSEQYIVLKSISSNGNWFYGFSMPSSKYYAPLTNSVIFAIFLYIIIILIGAVLIVFIVRKNSIPITKIVNILKTDDNTSYDSYDAYNYIEKKISTILNDKSTYLNKLNTQTDMFKNTILSSILTGKESNKIPTAEQLELLGINMNNENFHIIAIQYDNLTDMFIDEPDSIILTRKYEYAQLIISNIFGEALNEIFKATEVIIDGCNIFILNISNFEGDKFAKKLNDIITPLTLLIKKEFGFDIYISVSRNHNSINKLNNAYIETMVAMQYSLSSKKHIVHYDDIPHSHALELSAMIDFENNIAVSLKNNDLKNCKKLIYNALYKFQTRKNITPEMARSFSYNLLSTFFNQISKGADSASEEFISNIEITKILDNDLSASNILLRTTTIIDKYFAMFDSEAAEYQPQKNNFYENIKKYIDEHYTEPELHSVSLGATFNVNPSYMSTQFKKEFGCTITAYITDVRVENAKRLLLTTNLTNEEISEQVGFLNCRTFLRAFKKVENITPKEYKKINSPII